MLRKESKDFFSQQVVETTMNLKSKTLAASPKRRNEHNPGTIMPLSFYNKADALKCLGQRGGVILAHDTNKKGAKCYTVHTNINTFLKHYQHTPEKHHYEVIRPGIKCRFYVDLDEFDPKCIDSDAVKLFAECFEHCWRLLTGNSTDASQPPRLIVASATKDNKTSLHIHSPELVFANAKSVQDFATCIENRILETQVRPLMKFVNRKSVLKLTSCIDLGVYDKDRCFRLIDSTKKGSDRKLKILTPGAKLEDFLITHYIPDTVLGVCIKDSFKTTVEPVTIPVDMIESEIEKLVPDCKVDRKQNKKGFFYLVAKNEKSGRRCLITESTHFRNNCWVILTPDGSLIYQCKAQECMEKGKVIGKIKIGGAKQCLIVNDAPQTHTTSSTTTISLSTIANLQRSDTGLAEILRERIGDCVLFTNLNQTFFIWNDTTKLWDRKWFQQGTEVVATHLDAVIKQVIAEKPELKAELMKIAKYVLSNGSAKSIWEQFQNMWYKPEMEARMNVAEPLLLPIRGGRVVNLETGGITERQKQHYFTQELNVDFLGIDSPTPNVDDLFLKICGGDAEYVQYQKNIFGYAISGKNHKKAFFIIYGPRDNAKSTLEDLLVGVLGDFFISVDKRVIEKQDRPANHNAEILELIGKRLGVYSETGESMVLSDTTLKKLAGGGTDQLSARAPYGKEFIKFHPILTLFIFTNHKPVFDVFDAAMVERLRLLPCFTTFQKAENYKAGPNCHLATPEFSKHFLQQHRDEFFTWLVQGSIDFFSSESKFPPMPKLVQKETDSYLGELNWLRQFMQEHFVYYHEHERQHLDLKFVQELPPNEKTPAGEPFVSSETMLQLFETWAGLSGLDVCKRKFQQLMKKHYERDSTIIRWMGKQCRGYKWFALLDAIVTTKNITKNEGVGKNIL